MNEVNECFICFEEANEYEKYPSRLNKQNNFYKTCSCDGWIHENCMQIWYDIHNSCPICNTHIIYIELEYYYFIHIIYYLLIIKNIVYKLIPYVVKLNYLFIFIVCTTNIINNIEIYLLAINNYEKIDYNYQYHYQEYHYTNQCKNNLLDVTYIAPQIL
jgi:hypothetical protein